MGEARYFVTGTDTGVGKTVLSTVLSTGLGARYWKPVQTGADDGAADSDFVRAWIGADRVLPEGCVFGQPLAPEEAARLENRSVDTDSLLRAEAEISGPLIVEGAGGVLVPLNKQYLTVDLIARMRMPAIVAARTTLGTINHTLLTLEALRSRGVTVAGVALIGDENAANWSAIERHGRVRVIGRIPLCSGFSREWFQSTYRTLEKL